MSSSATPQPRSRASSLTRRPTTPLRRLSASSLRALSLSHSRSRNPSTHEPALQHLSSVFAELADSLSDLTGNLDALDQVNDQLDGFNQAFASYLYGLRITAYTADFNEAPTRVNFDLANTRRPASPPSTHYYNQHHSSPPQSPNTNTNTNANDESEFHSVMDPSFIDAAPSRTVRSAGGGRGTGTRGGGNMVRGGRIVSGMTRKKKEQMNAFADGVIQSLPLKYRETQPLRGETEKVIHALRDHPNGMTMIEAQKSTGVATHRVNDALTALVRAKSVLKIQAHGATLFRFDPSKYPVD